MYDPKSSCVVLIIHSRRYGTTENPRVEILLSQANHQQVETIQGQDTTLGDSCVIVMILSTQRSWSHVWQRLYSTCTSIYSANPFIDSSVASLTIVTHSFLLLMSPLTTLSTLFVNHPFNIRDPCSCSPFLHSLHIAQSRLFPNSRPLCSSTPRESRRSTPRQYSSSKTARSL